MTCSLDAVIRLLISLAALAERWASSRDFLRDHGETLAGIAGAGGLDARIQGEKVGLEGDFVDHPDDVADFARRILDFAHRVDGVPHDIAGAFGTRFVWATSWPASSARRLESVTVVVISSSAAAVSSMDAACCSVRLERSSAALRISLEPAAIAWAFVPTARIACFSLSTELLKLESQIFKRRDERLADRVVEIAIGQIAQRFGQFLAVVDATGYVGRELYDFDDGSVQAEDRIVACLDPDFLAALADALEFVGDKLSASQLCPEGPVVIAAGIGLLTEHAVVFALDFGQLVADGRQEIFVGVRGCRRSA